uniref:Uncharacterized protein n=1 Tax=Salvator merianae TaxID=96440 RepID=A0A8D0KL02_SALMN
NKLNVNKASWSAWLVCYLLDQGSPTFFAPGTNFKKDHFFMARQGGMEVGVGQGRGFGHVGVGLWRGLCQEPRLLRPARFPARHALHNVL